MLVPTLCRDAKVAARARAGNDASGSPLTLRPLEIS